MSKRSALLLIFALVFSGLVAVTFAYASAAKPSVPEFTLKHVVTPYNVPPAFRINPYTGENETLSPSYSGERHCIEITVKNEPFNPYIDANGNTVNLYYNVSLKGHYQDIWGHYPDSTYEDLFNASASDYTVIMVELGNYPSIPYGGKLDFRLEVLTGHYNYNRASSGTEYVTGFSTYETSGWSNTQTITIDENKPAVTPSVSLPSQSLSPSESQNPTTNQSSPQITIQLGMDWMQTALLALLGVIAVLLIFMTMFLLKRRVK